MLEKREIGSRSPMVATYEIANWAIHFQNNLLVVDYTKDSSNDLLDSIRI